MSKNPQVSPPLRTGDLEAGKATTPILFDRGSSIILSWDGMATDTEHFEPMIHAAGLPEKTFLRIKQIVSQLQTRDFATSSPFNMLAHHRIRVGKTGSKIDEMREIFGRCELPLIVHELAGILSASVSAEKEIPSVPKVLSDRNAIKPRSATP